MDPPHVLGFKHPMAYLGAEFGQHLYILFILILTVKTMLKFLLYSK